MPTPTPRPPRRRSHLTSAAVVSVLFLTTACGATEETAAEDPGSAAVIDDERCATNRDAGTVTYITGYRYQSSVSILEAIAADALGYFDAVCLDVKIVPGTGDTFGNAATVAAGDAEFTSMGNEGEILQAHEQGTDVIGVATYGHVPIATLLTGPEIEELSDLEGVTVGHKGALPPPIAAMLVSEGVDLESLDLVQVGYDPSVLPDGEVDALTAYRSNEPFLLDAMEARFVEWLPGQYGVVGSFGVMATDPEYAEANPTVVEDFLRALSYAFEYCRDDVRGCVEFAAELEEEQDYDVEHNQRIWEAEYELVSTYTTDGEPLGSIDLIRTEAEATVLLENGQLEEIPDLEPLFAPEYLESVHPAGEVSWPRGR
ncbi:ABC transporter substrate-binding protein [Nocardiopsis sp. FIRDI 009]|uniref:ABC transporter substrate-binding protein n=1 Tax=Nocardiopsis sp. FIRDI 009 TaxID=714197 RepID=UPI000E243485|nr:ABC transporter substrate-binding protein [Nocardiopsis sp. FIRDI 009]